MFTAPRYLSMAVPGSEGDTLVFVSPHPDDVAWSCGGLVPIARAAGRQVIWITVFDGDPARMPDTSSRRENWRLLAAPELRRREDRQAATRAGVTLVSLGFVDAALRRRGDTWLYPSPGALMQAMQSNDDVLDDVTRAMRVALAGADLVLAPLAHQGHVDHRVARHAVESAAPASSKLYLYEEFPYTETPPSNGKCPWIIPVEFRPWVALAMLYRSQMAAIFGNADRFRTCLNTWAHMRGKAVGVPYGVCLWPARAAR